MRGIILSCFVVATATVIIAVVAAASVDILYKLYYVAATASVDILFVVLAVVAAAVTAASAAPVVDVIVHGFT